MLLGMRVDPIPIAWEQRESMTSLWLPLMILRNSERILLALMQSKAKGELKEKQRWALINNEMLCFIF
jgi:hypothetical protein